MVMRIAVRELCGQTWTRLNRMTDRRPISRSSKPLHRFLVNFALLYWSQIKRKSFDFNWVLAKPILEPVEIRLSEI